MDGPEDLKAFEYAVLVTDLKEDMVAIFHHYRDRADCENNFDEIKNQWGWGGYTTHKIKSCQFMARMIALIYNWWNLFVRLALPDKHHEAITSRPLLLSSVGRLIEHSRQMVNFFNELKSIAPQLTSSECWNRILAKAILTVRPNPQPENLVLVFRLGRGN